MHADWVLLSARIAAPEGPLALHIFAVPAVEIEVIDTSQMAGMAATGNNDIAAQEVLVPRHRQFAVAPVRSGRGFGRTLHDDAKYGAPMLPNLCVAAAIPVVGAVPGALESCRERLRSHVKVGAGGVTVDKPAAQMRLARADLLRRSAEATLRRAAREVVAIGAINDEPDQTAERIRPRAKIAYAVSQRVEAVRGCCDAVGSSIHSLSHPLQRALRDVQVVQSHVGYDFDAASELHGRALVGLPPNSLLT